MIVALQDKHPGRAVICDDCGKHPDTHPPHPYYIYGESCLFNKPRKYKDCHPLFKKDIASWGMNERSYEIDVQYQWEHILKNGYQCKCGKHNSATGDLL